MKKYRLKEEVKKYFRMQKIHRDSVNDLDFWTALCVDIEALEEVEERVIVTLNKRQEGLDPNYYPFFLEKNHRGHWTEQEREDIEKFLNCFGSLENMYRRVTHYMKDFEIEAFDKWLKEKEL